MKQQRNRVIIVFVATIFVALLNFSCNGKNSAAKHKVLILGIDGMDHKILTKLIAEGKMPNFAKLAQTGGFKPLLSSIPAQSPVAWSNFITGMNPGGHGIFDFIHRKPGETILPYLSTTETIPPSRFIHLGKYQFPLKSGKVVQKRMGDAFWQILGKKGIPTVVYKIPSNFPPVKCENCETLAGMGTPDIIGTYGTFSYYTDNPPDNASSVTGGKVYTVWVENNTVNAELVGPPNSFLKVEKDAMPPDATAPFTVYIDQKANSAVIAVGDQRVVLKVGEWSGWVTISFKLAPLTPNVGGIVRFYLKEIKPDFKLYVTPVNIDPSNPALPVSEPESYSKDLVRDNGLFYTQGMREDTKALEYKALNDDEYVQQALIVKGEDMRIFWDQFGKWKDGLLFYYFSSLDLNQHTMWRANDPESPAYNAELNRKYGNFIENLYIDMDKLLGQVMERLDGETTLIILSDHGFAPYHRSFNLNTWLLDNGYAALNDPSARSRVEFLEGVDWSRTRAYNIGFNSLYINLRGRETNGIVEPGAEADALIEEISKKLEALIDEKTSLHPIMHAYIAKKVYSGAHVNEAPDIIVGFDRGYRNSDDSVLGKYPMNLFDDNLKPWSGDHCMDPEAVPGVLLSNRKITMEHPHLYDVTPTVLMEYGIAEPSDMVGKPVW